MALFCQFVHPLDTMFAKENANIREKNLSVLQISQTPSLFTLVWIAEKTLVDKNQNKVFKLRL